MRVAMSQYPPPLRAASEPEACYTVYYEQGSKGEGYGGVDPYANEHGQEQTEGAHEGENGHRHLGAGSMKQRPYAAHHRLLPQSASMLSW
jgi:hypothetical protein